ncbi:MAG TPA: HipA N-terminal domain-containing protein [Patescibacteria group bacterium]
MINKLKRLFNKNPDDQAGHVPLNEKVTFILVVDDIKLAELKSENGEWIFKYTEEFKKHVDKYNLIVGFPDIHKEYRSENLWPFFQIRIPGLKQPSVQAILKNENIDQQNEVELLKRFGRKTIANPYELQLASY